MPASVFHFKQFSIRQDRCAMKVGTDGVILGAWAGSRKQGKFLDVGTGTGILALMLAQRFPGCTVDAVEIEKDAASQASENIKNSPFSTQVNVVLEDFNEYLSETDATYDLVICNPPYFNNSLKASSDKRNLARHSSSLTMEQLIRGSVKILDENGFLSIVIPYDQCRAYDLYARMNGLFLRRQLNIISVPGKATGRVCMEFSRKVCRTEIRDLIIESSGRHQYSEEYKQLTQDFYL